MYGLNAVRVMFTSTSSEMATRRRRITSTVTGSIAVAAGAGAGLPSMIADNVDLSEFPDGERVTGANDRARSILDNKSWALTVEARLQRITIIDLGGGTYPLRGKRSAAPPAP